MFRLERFLQQFFASKQGEKRVVFPQISKLFHDSVFFRVGIYIVLLNLLLGACHDSDASAPRHNLDPNVEPVTEGSWYRPAPGIAWQWQLQGEINTEYDVDLYDIDLFDTDNAQITELQARGIHVVCYFSAGSSENWRDDFDRFTEEDLGKKLDGWDGERWLDIRSQNVWRIQTARLDLAVEKGCDGVEPDNVDAFFNDSGFDLTHEDQLTFNRNLANAAHDRGLFVGLKNDGEQAGKLVEYFDFALNEQCLEFDECEYLQQFIDADKAALHVEYADDIQEAQTMASTLCSTEEHEDLSTLILPLELDDSFRISCTETPSQ